MVCYAFVEFCVEKAIFRKKALQRPSCLILFIVELLLLLHILVQILICPFEAKVVGEYLLILVIKLRELWQAVFSFGQGVTPLQKLIYVIENQVVFENRNCVSLFIVNQIVDNFLVDIHLMHVLIILDEKRCLDFFVVKLKSVYYHCRLAQMSVSV